MTTAAGIGFAISKPLLHASISGVGILPNVLILCAIQGSTL